MKGGLKMFNWGKKSLEKDIVKEMDKDIEVIDEKLAQIKRRDSFYQVISACQDIDRILDKYMKEDK